MQKILKTIGIVLLSILAIFILLLVAVFIKTRIWRNSFEESIRSEYVVNSIVESKNIINEKLEIYILSEEEVDFVEFSPKEISQYLFNILTEMTDGTSINILEIYTRPEDNIWNICGLVNISRLAKISSWVCIDVTKDSTQTAQLYVKNITIDGINIGKIYPPILTKINQGIAEALVTANENGFVGRILENIELQKTKVVIKGSIY
jgi:hypothetical protein